ncbi:hypothetical protein H6G89_01640 [Oscillatoria sp. FACHB-1407]|uniref:hypothetical protein n=1 Tax=Oscillatoria sp. FACHB-1407 TaxID=2692847 RepID=UPI001683F18B|nr:hypothetical protein [Oscillatoria sp. FACHB-1407]MBD2459734.1 hypothetical protein [Oscillatoria sp. FACHB-1407]
MNSRLLEPSPPTRTPEKAGFAEPTRVGCAPIAAVLTAEILIPNSRKIGWAEQRFYPSLNLP